ncbi:WecB/TagA/CpsF family glycosyltransferase [Spirosoma sp. HMF4905]|uniref:WecB/TagA/CpsF family glycosyltransferase n=1 Tax=Spirosoma arboris TaxID=2682092 RepID=A0A7K1SIS5_9BACT|nr:WecB/TagA/CpsF family glycosyltransferase [Spirosoma arboris]MVM33717.1 WecB/TagA/CpsF family glycosyltransferase [Spirosoma arboris]
MSLSTESTLLPSQAGRKTVISLELVLIAYRQFIREIIQTAQQRQSGYACFANAHMVVEAVHDPAFASMVNVATWTTADGVPLAWALRLLYGIRQERITGLDVLPTLLQEAAQHEIPVYFYGSTAEVLNTCASFCHRHHPDLTIAGMYAPPFRPLTPSEEAEVIDRIRSSGAGLVFVALGCPKQEKWMAALSNRIPAVLLGVGGALPVTVGIQKRAPRWMQLAGLEWLYRFVQEPRRLFSRYFITNSLFVFYLTRQWIRQLRQTGN